MVFLVLIGIAIAAIIGIVICTAIRAAKNSSEKICRPGFDCTSILSGRYSTFLGIPLESAGMVYYIVVFLTAVAGVLYLKLGDISTIELDTGIFLMLGITGAGFAMSCYLTFVQAMYLRTWCFWCLMSTLFATIIFLLSILLAFSSQAAIVPVMVNFRDLIFVLHVTAFGACIIFATLADIIVFRFLRSFDMASKVETIFRFTSQALWVGLFIVILTALGLHLPDIIILKETTGVVVQTIFIAIIVVNAAFLNLVVSPSLYESIEHRTVSVMKIRVYRKIAFALGAISFVSWYAAFALALYPELNVEIGTLLGLYVAVTFIAVGLSQVVEVLSCKVTV